MRLLTLAVLLVVALPVSLPPAQAAERPLRVLFWARGITLDPQYAAELQAKGIALDPQPLTKPFSLRQLKSYNLVIIPDFLGLDAPYEVGATDVPDWWEVNLPNLREYVDAGGGLLVTTFFCGGGEGLAAGAGARSGAMGGGLSGATDR